MKPYERHSEFAIESNEALRNLYEPTHPIAIRKSQSFLSSHAQDFIRRSPFLCIGTQSAEGNADVSPRGDPPGFVSIIDTATLAIPDRPGNNRLDTLVNILANPSVGLLFIIPGFDDTLRVNGRATLSKEPELLGRMIVNDRAPKLAIVVSVNEVFLHCAKAFRRSHLWSPDHFQDRRGMPSLVKMILDDTTGAPNTFEEQQKLDRDLEDDYKKTLY